MQVDLLDGEGNVIAHDVHRCGRRVRVHRPAAGHVRVREHQPTGYFDLRAHVGDGGGTTARRRQLARATSTSARASTLTNYDFCEKPPAEISGYVYIDGAADRHERSAHAAANRRASRRPAHGRRHAARRRRARAARRRRRATPISSATGASRHVRGRRDRSDSRHDRCQRLLSFRRPARRHVCRRPSSAGRRDRQRRYAGHARRLCGEPGRHLPSTPAVDSDRRAQQAIIEQFRDRVRRRRDRADSARGRPALAGEQLQRSADRCRTADVPPPEPPPPPEPIINVFGEPNFPARIRCGYKLPPLPTRTPDWIGGSSEGDRLHVALERRERRLAAERDAEATCSLQLTAAPIDVGRAGRTCRSTPAQWTLGRARRRQRRRSCARRRSARRRRCRSPATSTATASRDIGVYRRRPVVSRPQRQRPVGRGRPVGQARQPRTICRSPATGTPTARPTSASTARRGPRDPWAIAARAGPAGRRQLPDAAGRQDEEHAADGRGRHQRRPAC